MPSLDAALPPRRARTAGQRMHRVAWRWALAGVACALLGACGDDAQQEQASNASASYVGSASCQGCHSEAFGAWRGSHHDLAMQEASAANALGDFEAAVHDAHGRAVRFEREGEQLFVEAEGPAGGSTRFPVEFLFGVEPLQQLLLPLPGGRLQSFTSAWDARPLADGGRRWFELRDEAAPPGDVLHWTGSGYLWNARCAECHSTNVRKNWNASEQRYATRWSEIDVGCEACHGPASLHLAWAEGSADGSEAGSKADGTRGLTVQFGDRARWIPDAQTGIARRSAPLASSVELDTCAPCHSRRTRIADGEAGGPFLDAYRPALLEQGLYFADGQIDDEVFVWGSFVQSRMHAAGVRCSDCHDPHSLRLRAGNAPDAGCATCHAPERFAVATHHHHPVESEGARCVSCHMPARVYMQIDARRDHSFRVPRPDLSASLGTPNACNGCHAEHTPQWAAERVRAWRGDTARGDARTHFAHALAAGRRGDADAPRALAVLAEAQSEAPIVRATALSLLASWPQPELVPLVRRSAQAPEALVRWGALLAAERLPAEQVAQALAPLLDDPLRLIRSEAARVLAGAPLPPSYATARERGLQELFDAFERDADLPASHVGRALVELSRGRVREAETAYRDALRLDDPFVPAWANLADLLRALGREDEALATLREGLARVPESADLEHALGLALVRAGRHDDALAALRRASEGAPESALYATVVGLALHSLARDDEAIAFLEQAQRRHPKSGDLLWALATIQRDAGRRDAALRTAEALIAVDPDHPQAAALREQLRDPLRTQ